MTPFNKTYFRRFYRGTSDRNPEYKLRAYLSRILHWAPKSVLTGPARLLDIGCGYGRFLAVAKSSFDVYGIDPSSFAVKAARQIVGTNRVSVNTLEAYRPDVKFDVVTVLDVLEHIDNRSESVKKIAKLLKPGGICLIVVPVYDGLLGTIGGWLDKDPTHIHKRSRFQWIEECRSKFQVLEMQGIIRYSLYSYYIHLMKPWVWRWGQALLLVLKKP